MPLPSEETTPPVTKMNFVVWCRALGCIIQSSGLFRARETVPIRVRASKVFFRIDAAPRRITYDRDAHRHARGKWPQLLESLNLLGSLGSAVALDRHAGRPPGGITRAAGAGTPGGDGPAHQLTNVAE